MGVREVIPQSRAGSRPRSLDSVLKVIGSHGKLGARGEAGQNVFSIDDSGSSWRKTFRGWEEEGRPVSAPNIPWVSGCPEGASSGKHPCLPVLLSPQQQFSLLCRDAVPAEWSLVATARLKQAGGGMRGGEARGFRSCEFYHLEFLPGCNTPMLIRPHTYNTGPRFTQQRCWNLP